MDHLNCSLSQSRVATGIH